MADIGWVSADNPVVQQIDDAALRYGVDRNLAHVVAQMESSYRPDAVSPVGAQGVMQLMPTTGRTLGLQHPFDSKENIDAGMRLLSDLIRKYGADTPRVLAAYNAGEPAVDRAGGVPNFPETQNYVTKGMGLLNPRPEQTAQAPAPPPSDTDIGWVGIPAAPPKPAELSPVEKAASAYWHGVGPVLSTLFTLGKGLSGNPLDAAAAGKVIYDTAQGMASELPGWTPSGGFRPGRALSEWGATGDALMHGRFADALYHLGGSVPFLGGQGQEIAQDVNRNDPASAVGHTASMLTQALGPKMLEELAPAVGTAATFTKGAVPEAAAAMVKRPPYGATLLGGMFGGPKGAAAAAALVKVPQVIRAGIAGGRAALEEAATTAAEQSAADAAAAATARAAADDALARQVKVYETGERMTQPPARPELPPASSYQMPEAGTYAEEQRIRALAPEGGPPAAPTLEQLTEDRFPGRKFDDLSADQQTQVRSEFQSLQQPAFRQLFEQPPEMTPGQAYAASQGVDWKSLRPIDQQMMEQIARANANVAAQPEPAPPARVLYSPPAPQAPPLTVNDLATSLSGKPPSALTGADIAAAQNLAKFTTPGSLGEPPSTVPPVAPPEAPTAPAAPAPAPTVPPAPEAVAGPPVDPVAWTREQLAAGNKVSPGMLQRRFDMKYSAARKLLKDLAPPATSEQGAAAFEAAKAAGEPAVTPTPEAAPEAAPVLKPGQTPAEALRDMLQESTTPPSTTIPAFTGEGPKSLADLMGAIPEPPEPAKLDWAQVTRTRNVDALEKVARQAGITPEMLDQGGDAAWKAIANKAKIGPKNKPDWVPSETTRSQLRERFSAAAPEGTPTTQAERVFTQEKTVGESIANAKAKGIDGLGESLENAANDAMNRIEKRGDFKGTRLNAGIPVDTMADLGIWGAAKMAKGVVDFGKWSKEMLAEAGPAAEKIRPALQQIYAQAQKNYARFVASTEDRLPNTRKLLKMYRDGIDAKEWYDHAKVELEKVFGPDVDKFIDFLAATSPNSTVASNTGLALKAFAQWKLGRPFEGYLPDVIPDLEKVARGEDFGATKIQNFARNLHGDPISVTIDRWMARALGFKTDSPTAAQYKFMDYLVSQVAAKQGVEPRQMQAALWKAIKDTEGVESQGAEPYHVLTEKKFATKSGEAFGRLVREAQGKTAEEIAADPALADMRDQMGREMDRLLEQARKARERVAAKKDRAAVNQ